MLCILPVSCSCGIGANREDTLEVSSNHARHTLNTIHRMVLFSYINTCEKYQYSITTGLRCKLPEVCFRGLSFDIRGTDFLVDRRLIVIRRHVTRPQTQRASVRMLAF